MGESDPVSLLPDPMAVMLCWLMIQHHILSGENRDPEPANHERRRYFIPKVPVFVTVKYCQINRDPRARDTLALYELVNS